ncbi:hypothetical protein D2A34_17025 [Clostridium chromiireducens]|uniref:Uncharacterized protein n=1 Tax=Clostridium chromiireducens TaxID=225345 RepID=A0A399IR95_9CLOT|nr:hypothetical protein [Clostridium chromiireducens]RII33446.1 hypothetical protein D2A34_17025 [Clostridium chromiireducens]
MTILDMLNKINKNNKLMAKGLEIIKDNYTSLVNDNYELVINEDGELNVKIPSLEKRDEYVYKSIGEYEYPLVMCMRIPDTKNVDKYNYVLGKFMELYKDKLDLLFKDVNTIEKLKENVVKTKNRIDYTTYASIFLGVIGAIALCIVDFFPTTRSIFILGIILFFILSLVIQLSKENQIKKIIDGYLSVIKTEWYKKQLSKEYAFLCNLAG